MVYSLRVLWKFDGVRSPFHIFVDILISFAVWHIPEQQLVFIATRTQVSGILRPIHSSDIPSVPFTNAHEFPFLYLIQINMFVVGAYCEVFPVRREAHSLDPAFCVWNGCVNQISIGNSKGAVVTSNKVRVVWHSNWSWALNRGHPCQTWRPFTLSLTHLENLDSLPILNVPHCNLIIITRRYYLIFSQSNRQSPHFTPLMRHHNFLPLITIHLHALNRPIIQSYQKTPLLIINPSHLTPKSEAF